MREGINAEANIQANVEQYEYQLFKVHLERLAISAADEIADQFGSISKVKDAKELDNIVVLYTNKERMLKFLISIYGEKLSFSENLEKQIVIRFLANFVKNLAYAKYFKSISHIRAIDEMSKVFLERIAVRRRELEGVKEKQEPGKTVIKGIPELKSEELKLEGQKLEGQKPKPVVFEYRNVLNKDVEKRLLKISEKNKMTLKTIAAIDWNNHLNKIEEKIKKLSSLSGDGQFRNKYFKAKTKKERNVTISAEEKIEHYEVKQRLYKDMKFSKGPKNDSYSIKEIDSKNNKLKMDVVTTYNSLDKSVEIIANEMDTEDHYILTMVEQAREIVKQFLESGRSLDKLSIEIENCAKHPETAIKLKAALQLLDLGLEGKYDKETQKSVEKYEAHLPKRH